MQNAKRLGQYFLENQAAVKKIISALELKRGDTAVEIGPGMGALTDELAIKNQDLRILGIEKDPRLAEALKARYADKANIEIVCADALKALPEITRKSGIETWKLCGNIPYYITGRLLRILSELPKKPKLSVFTIQREVAERIVAKPPRMNLLSAITQAWAEPAIIALLKPEDFDPQPDVESAAIKLITREQNLATDVPNYHSLIRNIFKQPRKTVFNNLRAGFGDKALIRKTLEKHGLTGSERPQDISLALLIKLARALAKNIVV